MLQSLSIQNYALIDSLEINFNKGYSIITGETGSGKSILLGALSLILGNRADVNFLKDKSKKCIIEGAFRIDDYKLEDFFNEIEVDYEEIAIIRRTINPNGKSRSFVNDIPVNLNTLRALGSRLVDIHSQHQNLIVNDTQFQLKVVDIFADNSKHLNKYSKHYKKFRKIEKEYNNLISKSEKAKSDFDYLQHKYNELNSANLIKGELEDFEKELNTLNHSEEIKNRLVETFNYLSGNENTALSFLKGTINSTEKIYDYFPQVKDINVRLNSVYIELQDIVSEVEVLVNDIEYDPVRIEFINERLNLLYNLQQKYRVASVQELMEIKQTVKLEIDDVTSFDGKIEDLHKELIQVKVQLSEIAEKLSARRLKVIPKIEKTIVEQLKQLGILNADFKIKLEKAPEFANSGIDKVVFLFTANKKSELQEISKVASGGEVSRLMLSIKSLISSSVALPTIIFDEIDTGVSGDVADKVGNIMRSMSSNIQVLSITHLPQVAAKGDYHYLVFKKDEKDTTNTKIKILDNKERVHEIAKMLSGSDLTDAALENAKELMKN